MAAQIPAVGDPPDSESCRTPGGIHSDVLLHVEVVSVLAPVVVGGGL